MSCLRQVYRLAVVVTPAGWTALYPRHKGSDGAAAAAGFPPTSQRICIPPPGAGVSSAASKLFCSRLHAQPAPCLPACLFNLHHRFFSKSRARPRTHARTHAILPARASCGRGRALRAAGAPPPLWEGGGHTASCRVVGCKEGRHRYRYGQSTCTGTFVMGACGRTDGRRGRVGEREDREGARS
jgi:hypothetical protein